MESVEKPLNWPANNFELKLDLLANAMEDFRNNPNYETKAKLLSLVNNYDLNQDSNCGLYRTTEYEVACLNTLYFDSLFCLNTSVRCYVYKLIENKTRLAKIISMMTDLGDAHETLIKEYSGLHPHLLFYHLVYNKFIVEKSKSFANQLIDVVNEILSIAGDDNDKVFDLARSYISVVNDISGFVSSNTNSIWKFDRVEIKKLYLVASRLIKLTRQNPIQSPLKGVLMTSISNFILKSRNEYNSDYICKYLTNGTALNSFNNHQIWLRSIKNLNDKREQKVLSELFKNKNWISYSWARNVSFEPSRIYYVSCFCKNYQDEQMKSEYGSCVYGYKTDVIAEQISPIGNMKFGEKEMPTFTQVVAFDVLYDRETIKSEINYLCEIIDILPLKEVDKTRFFQEIAQYWLLSVKDKKWEHEKERRYVLFLYDDHKYLDMDITDPDMLKVDSSIFLYPDFILGDNPVKEELKKYALKKSQQCIGPHIFCNDCLNIDFDSYAMNMQNNFKCQICGSSDIVIVEH